MIFVQSEYVHIKINCPLSSKLFIQQPEFKKNMCLIYSVLSLLRSEDGLLGCLRSWKKQKDVGKNLDVEFREV